MEEDENDLENIFEEYEGDNDEPGTNNEGNNGLGNETQTAERVPVPKRIVKNPRLKFNAERLCGERGIPVLINHFKDVKFKGKGHEVEDLNKLISTLEHWCHRLYPSMKLDDCLRQIEKLGKKRPVQTCLRKIRMDMPILSRDFIGEEDNNEPEMDIELPPQDDFDRLINETQLVSTPIAAKTPAPVERSLGTYGSTLTEEQKKRMEYNKLLATERRKSRLTSMQAGNLNNEKTYMSDSISKELEIMDECATFNLICRNEELEVNNENTGLNDSASKELEIMEYTTSNSISRNEELEVNNKNTSLNDSASKELEIIGEYTTSNSFSRNEELEVNIEKTGLNDSASKELEIMEYTTSTISRNEELELDDLVDLVDEEDFVGE